MMVERIKMVAKETLGMYELVVFSLLAIDGSRTDYKAIIRPVGTTGKQVFNCTGEDQMNITYLGFLELFKRHDAYIKEILQGDESGLGGRRVSIP